MGNLLDRIGFLFYHSPVIKKAFLIAVCLLLLATPVHAQQKGPDNAGILPTSPLYPLEQVFEKLGVFITFTSTAKAERLFLHSEERFAEAEALLAMGEIELAGKTLVAYEEKVAASLEKVEEAEADGQDTASVREKVQKATAKHQEVLQRVYEKVPEEAKPAIERALENSRKGHEKAPTAGVKDGKKEKQEEKKGTGESQQSSETNIRPSQSEGKSRPQGTVPQPQSLQKQLPESAQEVKETVQGVVDEAAKIPMELPQKQRLLEIFGR